MLSARKRKNHKVGLFLIFLLVGELIHHGLSTKGMVLENYGISFGIKGSFFVFIGIMSILLLTIIWWRYEYLGISIILIGGWMNLLDRLIFGYVRDYWQLGWVYNNLADWIIQFGVIIFLTELWRKKLK